MTDKELQGLEYLPRFTARLSRGTEFREIHALMLSDAIDRMAAEWDVA